MATGDKMFSTAGQTPVKYESTPLTPGEYKGKLRTKDASVGKRPEPGKFPYVSYKIEVLDTASTEGGKNRQLFEMLFTSLKPGKDGNLMPKRANQFLGLVRALGAGDVQIPQVTMKDENDEAVPCLSAQHLQKWLQQQDGAIITLKVKTQKGDGTYPAKSVVDQYVEVESDAPTGFGEQEEQGTDAPQEEAAEYVDEDGNPVDAEGNPIEQEEAPKPVVKKTAPKAAPALKAVAGKKR